MLAAIQRTKMFTAELSALDFLTNSFLNLVFVF